MTSISAAADPKSRVYSVEVRIDNPQNLLKSGMIASITIGAGQPMGRVAVFRLPPWCAALPTRMDLRCT